MSSNLYMCYGLEVRLMSGFGILPVTNNLIENRNMLLKKRIGSQKRPINAAIKLIIETDTG